MSGLYRDNGGQGPFNIICIICDFDGTITPLDTTDLILSHFAPPQWEEVEQQWVEGLISARECMYRQVKMLQADQAELDAFIDEIPLAPGFKEFIVFAENLRLKPRIVSDGLDYVIRRVLAAHQIPDIEVTANHLRFTEGGFELEFPHGRSNCGSGVCKCAVAEGPGRTILIGDGRSDLCLAGQADYVLARRGFSLEGHCQEKGWAHTAYDNFYDIVDFFKNIYRPLLAGFSQYPAGRLSPLAGASEIK